MRRRGRLLAAVSLALAVALLGAPGGLDLLGLGLAFAGCAVGLRGHRDRSGVLAVVGLCGALSAMSLAGAGAAASVGGGPRLDAAAWERSYAGFWERLRGAARRAANRLGEAPPAADRSRAFAVLDGEAQAASPMGLPLQFLLVDADGAAMAWSGSGFLHEAPAGRWPARGAWVRAGFSSGTFAWVEETPLAGAGWRIVAGASFSREDLPFQPPRGGATRWALALEPEDSPPAPGLLLEAEGAPSLRVTWERAGRPSWRGLRRAAAALLAAALLGLAWAGFRRRNILGGTVWRRRGSRVEPLVLAAAALGAAGQAAGAGFGLSLHLGLAAALAAAALNARPPRRATAPWADLVRPALAVVAVAGLAALARRAPSAWLALLAGQDLVPSGEEAVARGAWGLTVVAVLAACAWATARQGSAAEGPRRDGYGAAAVLAACAAGLLLDHRPLAIALATGAAWMAMPCLRPPAGGSWGRLGTGILAALILAGALWRTEERHRLASGAPALLEQLGPPRAEETSALALELRARAEGLDLRRLGPAPPRSLDSSDLAFEVWRALPLNRRNAVSAVTVQWDDGALSSFAFGLPLAGGDIDRASPNHREVSLLEFQASRIEGSARLALDGAPAVTVRYWFLPQPGFRLDSRPLEDPRWRLLAAGSVAGRRRIEGLPSDLRAVVADADGSILRATPGADGASSAGPGRLWRRRAEGQWTALAMPPLRLVEAWDRSATLALTPIAGMVGLALLAGLLALGRRSGREAFWALARSYSTRLLVAVILLAVVPLSLLQIVSIRAFEASAARTQERDAGESLDAAQRVLSQYLATLEPGFSLDTVLDDALLRWLAQVVDRDLNLYWGSVVYATSQSELFETGLLPRRIPGDVFRGISLDGERLVARDNRVEGRSYAELYVPLRLGASGAAPPLVLSLPLLAQQEEASAAAAVLRRRSVLASCTLLLVLAAVASRLARNFTRPIRELVTATQEIARGARVRPVAPRETELALLASAIDRMAQRIAVGREQILREKRLLEGVVEHLDAAVWLLDGSGKVLLANRAARDQVGIEAGRNLRDQLGDRPAWEPLLAWSETASLGASPLRPLTFRAPRASPPAPRPGEGAEREWTALILDLPPGGEARRLVALDDATEVLRGQRLEAWAEMARLIAHEIKNPLTPIRLATEHLREVRERNPERLDEVFERCTLNILRQVEELRAIASEFSTYSQLPRIDLVPHDLARLVRETAAAYLGSPDRPLHLRYEGPPSGVTARVDPKLLSRALRNLIENAWRAMANRDAQGEIEVVLQVAARTATIEVRDRGPGVPDAWLERIFEPYFSTHEGGTGLGLPIARRVLEAHGGSLVARPRVGGGLVVRMTLPLPDAEAALEGR